MERRRTRQSLDAYREHLQRVLSCVLPAPVVLAVPAPGRTPSHFVSLGGGFPTPIHRSDLLLRIRETIDVHAVAPASITITGYLYALEQRTAGEVLAFHWHPETPGSVHHPHLHIGPALLGTDGTVRRGDAHKLHVPTGIVTLEAVLRLAIEELGIEPRRADWQAILASPYPTGFGGSSP